MMVKAWNANWLSVHVITSDYGVLLQAREDGEDNGPIADIAGIVHDGLYRLSLDAGVQDACRGLGVACDEVNNCIALHPDDPAMVRIRELEAEVERLRDTPPTLADHIVGSVNDHVAEVKAERDKALARVAELEAAATTVAPELTDAQCKKLQHAWFSNTGRGKYVHVRTMIAAYEAMRRPATDEDVENLARRLRAAWAEADQWNNMLDRRSRDDWRRVARAALEYRG